MDPFDIRIGSLMDGTHETYRITAKSRSEPLVTLLNGETISGAEFLDTQPTDLPDNVVVTLHDRIDGPFVFNLTQHLSCYMKPKDSLVVRFPEHPVLNEHFCAYNLLVIAPKATSVTIYHDHPDNATRVRGGLYVGKDARSINISKDHTIESLHTLYCAGPMYNLKDITGLAQVSIDNRHPCEQRLLFLNTEHSVKQDFYAQDGRERPSLSILARRFPDLENLDRCFIGPFEFQKIEIKGHGGRHEIEAWNCFQSKANEITMAQELEICAPIKIRSSTEFSEDQPVEDGYPTAKFGVGTICFELADDRLLDARFDRVICEWTTEEDYNLHWSYRYDHRWTSKYLECTVDGLSEEEFKMRANENRHMDLELAENAAYSALFLQLCGTKPYPIYISFKESDGKGHQINVGSNSSEGETTQFQTVLRIDALIKEQIGQDTAQQVLDVFYLAKETMREPFHMVKPILKMQTEKNYAKDRTKRMKSSIDRLRNPTLRNQKRPKYFDF